MGEEVTLKSNWSPLPEHSVSVSVAFLWVRSEGNQILRALRQLAGKSDKSA